MPRQNINPHETRRERFKRLAQYRTQRVLDAIRILSHCSNAYLYEYDDREVTKIFEAIEEELRLVRSKFTSPKGKRIFAL